MDWSAAVKRYQTQYSQETDPLVNNVAAPLLSLALLKVCEQKFPLLGVVPLLVGNYMGKCSVDWLFPPPKMKFKPDQVVNFPEDRERLWSDLWRAPELFDEVDLPSGPLPQRAQESFTRAARLRSRLSLARKTLGVCFALSGLLATGTFVYRSLSALTPLGPNGWRWPTMEAVRMGALSLFVGPIDPATKALLAPLALILPLQSLFASNSLMHKWGISTRDYLEGAKNALIRRDKGKEKASSELIELLKLWPSGVTISFDTVKASYLKDLGSQCDKITSLMIADGADLTDQDLVDILKELPNLRWLHITRGSNLTGSFLKSLPKNLHNLEIPQLKGDCPVDQLPNIQTTIHAADRANLEKLFKVKLSQLTVGRGKPDSVQLWTNKELLEAWHRANPRANGDPRFNQLLCEHWSLYSAGAIEAWIQHEIEAQATPSSVSPNSFISALQEFDKQLQRRDEKAHLTLSQVIPAQFKQLCTRLPHVKRWTIKNSPKLSDDDLTELSLRVEQLTIQGDTQVKGDFLLTTKALSLGMLEGLSHQQGGQAPHLSVTLPTFDPLDIDVEESPAPLNRFEIGTLGSNGYQALLHNLRTQTLKIGKLDGVTREQLGQLAATANHREMEY